MFALIDCDSFYVSCERLFRPDLKQAPVAVLSNNDGCVVSRSAEVKALGVPMGAPHFKVRKQLQSAGASVFSSNYTLYGDLSGRVMDILATLSAEIEVYSIDEAFVGLTGLPAHRWEGYGHQLRDAVYQQVGIPVSVGLAPTKTLAKLASRIAKRGGGVCSLWHRDDIHTTLTQFAVEDIWGIGPRFSKKLSLHNVFTASEFIAIPEWWVQKQMTVVGLRTHRELRGIPCIAMESAPPPRQTMVHSRSFPGSITELDVLQEATASFAARLGAKLRRHHLHATWLRVFLVPARRVNLPGRGISGSLPWPTADTRALIMLAHQLLSRIWEPGLPYGKAGVMALELRSDTVVQQSLLSTPPDPAVMAALDAVNNKLGAGTIRLAAEGTPRARQWRGRSNLRSPRYTTRWSELPVIRAESSLEAARPGAKTPSPSPGSSR